jgi:hypothetical protein
LLRSKSCGVQMIPSMIRRRPTIELLNVQNPEQGLATS